MQALDEALYEAQDFPAADYQRLEARLREKKDLFLDPFSNKPPATAPPQKVLQYIAERRAALERLAHLFRIRRYDDASDFVACITRFTNELLAEDTFTERLLTGLRVCFD
jgi:hypothetical protein